MFCVDRSLQDRIFVRLKISYAPESKLENSNPGLATVDVKYQFTEISALSFAVEKGCIRRVSFPLISGRLSVNPPS